MPSRSPVNATRTTFEIIQALLDMRSAGVSELAEELDKPKSTVHDHLQTLLDMGYVVQDEKSGYRVSTKMLFIGESIREQMDIYQTARSELISLANDTGEYVSLMIQEGARGILLFTTRGKKATQLSISPIRPGTETELHTTAPGKAIFANLSPDERESILMREELVSMTQNTITDVEELRSELESVRKRGFAVDDEERIIGMRGIGVPILDREGDVEGAISIYGPTRRMEGAYFEEELPQIAMETANVIEVNINYS